MKTNPKSVRKYAFYSVAAIPRNGIVIWKTVDGGTVRATGIGLDPDCSAYKWPNKVLLGEVVEFVRREKEPEVPAI